MIFALFPLFAISGLCATNPPPLKGLKVGKTSSFKAEDGCMRYNHASTTGNFYVRTECDEDDANVEYGPTKIVKSECESYSHWGGDWFYGMTAEMDGDVWFEGDEKKAWTACYCNWWMKFSKSDEILTVWSYKEQGPHVEGDWEINEDICRAECKSASFEFKEMGETVLQGGDYHKVPMGLSEGWIDSEYNLDVCIDNPWSSKCSNSCEDIHTENNVTPSQEFPPALEGHWVNEEWYQNVLVQDEMKNYEGCEDYRWITPYGSTYVTAGCKHTDEASVTTTAILENSCAKVFDTVYGRTVEVDQGWADWLGCYCMYWRVHPADGENRRTVDYVWAMDKSVNSYDDIDRCGVNCPEPENPSVYLRVGPDHLHFGGQHKYVCEGGECLDETTHQCGSSPKTCGDKGMVKSSDSKDKAGKVKSACECQEKCMEGSNDYFSFKLPNNEGGKGSCFCHKGGKVKKNEKSKMLVGGV